MPSTVISIANVAAGVGKTTIALSLATELSLRGHKTLLIDADPQAAATEYFINPAMVKRSLADVLHPTSDAIYDEPVQAAITSLSDVIVQTRFNHLHLVPGSIWLAAFESNIFVNISTSVLESQIEQLDAEYDFIIIDTPSSLGQITNTCLRASTHVIVPVAPRNSSVHGLQLVNERIGDMPCLTNATSFGVMPCGYEKLELLGVVFNHFDCQRPMSGTLFTELKSEWKDRCFDTAIHRDSLIESCTKRHEVLQAEHSRSQAATLYAELTDEILLRLALPLDVPYMRDALEAR